MKYRALYRETRPEVFPELLGQDHIVKILKHQIATDTVSHAYLFTGTRGTGKTTTARILSKAVNCLDEDLTRRPCGECANCRAIAEGNFMDVIEIDAASNNGVENIRELRESVNYPPATGRKKVYIIDEVHMLTQGAYNALLKTLEEPPEDVMFILATTDPEKLSQTVRSRCMRLDFRRVSADVLADHMEEICLGRGVHIAKDALRLLASNADGSVRDSLSILEQCLSSGLSEISRNDVLDLLGTVSVDYFIELTEKVMTRNISQAFLLLDDALRQGKDVRQLMQDWMSHLRSLLITKYVHNPEELLNMSTDNIALLKVQSDRIDVQELESAIVTLAKAINDARYSTQARTLMEVAIVAIASGMEYGKAPGQVQHAQPQPVAAAPVQAAAPAAPPQARQQAAAVTAPRPAAPKTELSSQRKPKNEYDDFRSDAPAGPVKPRKQAPKEKNYSRQELDEMWNEVFETLEPEFPKLNVMRRATLAEIREEEYKVLVPTEMEKRLLESERAVVDGEIAARIGRPVGMSVKLLQESGHSDADQKIQEEADAASKLLGVKVRVVDNK